MRHKDLLPALALIGGWIAAMAVVVYLVIDGRANTLLRVERTTAALARSIDESTARTFQSAVLVARGVADGWWLVRPRRHDAAFQRVLENRLADLPQASALFVLGPDGRIVNDTSYPRTSNASFADRPYFQAYRSDAALKSAVFGPYFSRVRGVDWFMAATARLGPPGEFHGVVGAAVPRDSFERLYAGVALTEGDAITLFHRDGTLIARHPTIDEEIGRNFSRLALFRKWLPSGEQNTFRATGHMVEGKRIISYRAVEGLPLIVAVSRDEHAILAEWRRVAVGAGVAMGALTLLLAGVLVRELRRRRQRERERAKRAQAEKMEALGLLTGGIAHDFGNLLGVISNSLYLISSQDPGSLGQALDVARRSVSRGQNMVDRLLAFARRQPLEIRPADLNALVTQVHPLLAQAVGSHVELVLQLAPGLPPVLTDESQFEMAVLNLVVNARDALGGRGRVVLRTHAERDGDACLSVEDEGPGMPEETRRRAVEPFFSTKGDTGTGLGLAQVYGFMQQIGGALEIESAPGKGTRVHLRFPSARRQGTIHA